MLKVVNVRGSRIDRPCLKCKSTRPRTFSRAFLLPCWYIKRYPTHSRRCIRHSSTYSSRRRRKIFSLTTHSHRAHMPLLGLDYILANPSIQCDAFLAFLLSKLLRYSYCISHMLFALCYCYTPWLSTRVNRYYSIARRRWMSAR